MHRKAQVLGAMLLAGLFTLSFQAAATTITTTSYSTWDTTSYITGSPTGEIDLTSLETGLSYDTIAGYSSNGYTIVGPDGSSYYLKNVNINVSNHHWGLEGAADGTGLAELLIPGSGANALLLDTYCVNCGASSLKLTLSDGETFTVPNGQFGLSISHDVTWFELSAVSGANAFLDYAYFGNSALPQDPSPANEAATPVLVGGGLMVLVGAGRKKFLRRR